MCLINKKPFEKTLNSFPPNLGEKEPDIRHQCEFRTQVTRFVTETIRTPVSQAQLCQEPHTHDAEQDMATEHTHTHSLNNKSVQFIHASPEKHFSSHTNTH